MFGGTRSQLKHEAAFPSVSQMSIAFSISVRVSTFIDVRNPSLSSCQLDEIIQQCSQTYRSSPYTK